MYMHAQVTFSSSISTEEGMHASGNAAAPQIMHAPTEHNLFLASHRCLDYFCAARKCNEKADLSLCHCDMLWFSDGHVLLGSAHRVVTERPIHYTWRRSWGYTTSTEWNNVWQPGWGRIFGYGRACSRSVGKWWVRCVAGCRCWLWMPSTNSCITWLYNHWAGRFASAKNKSTEFDYSICLLEE